MWGEGREEGCGREGGKGDDTRGGGRGRRRSGKGWGGGRKEGERAAGGLTVGVGLGDNGPPDGSLVDL